MAAQPRAEPYYVNTSHSAGQYVNQSPAPTLAIAAGGGFGQDVCARSLCVVMTNAFPDLRPVHGAGIKEEGGYVIMENVNRPSVPDAIRSPAVAAPPAVVAAGERVFNCVVGVS